MALLLFFAFLSIFFSFLCSILEAVLLSVTSSYISIKEQEGSPIAEDLRSLKEDIDKPLSAILTLNTVAHTVGAIGVGAVAGTVFSKYFTVAGFQISSDAVIATVMTLAVLILSEIIPKTLGANYWESLTPFAVKMLKILLFLLAPLVWVSQLITKKLKKDKGKSVFSRTEFVAMTEVSTQSGAIKAEEGRIIQNLLKFNNILVEDIMTPRTVVQAASEGKSLNDFFKANNKLSFSRIPLYKSDMNDVTGYFLKDDLLLHLVNGKGENPLSSIKRKHSTTTTTTAIGQLFNEMTELNEHFALVYDKHGTMTGIITMEDIIETLLGLEIMDEYDNVEDLQKLARKKFEERNKNKQA